MRKHHDSGPLILNRCVCTHTRMQRPCSASERTSWGCIPTRKTLTTLGSVPKNSGDGGGRMDVGIRVKKNGMCTCTCRRRFQRSLVPPSPLSLTPSLPPPSLRTPFSLSLPPHSLPSSHFPSHPLLSLSPSLLTPSLPPTSLRTPFSLSLPPHSLPRYE